MTQSSSPGTTSSSPTTNSQTFNFNRAEAVDLAFLRRVKAQDFPPAKSTTTLTQAGLAPHELVDLFESQVMSRHLDLRARILKNDNQCFYTIGSSGHEGNAAVGKAFEVRDMAFLHYRSGALMIQRAKHLPHSTPLYDTMLSFVASKDEPIAGGRHKVWGSVELNVPPQTSTIASHLPKALGAALSIRKAQRMNLQDATLDPDSVILCSFGDASANHSTAVGAINAACWAAYQDMDVPVVFLCEDNQIGISVPTPQDWIKANFSQRPQLNYIECDGLNLCDSYIAAKEAVDYARQYRKPVFLHMKTVRLLGHAGSDVETTYKQAHEIESIESDDPLLHSARILIEHGILSADQIISLYESVRTRVEHIGRYAVQRPKITDPHEIASTVIACTNKRTAPPIPNEAVRTQAFDKDFAKLSTPQHMAKLINWGLIDLMIRYPGFLIFGEDVAQKGGVYNVTEGLYKKFGEERIYNTLLDEQTIIGHAIGLAHNGFLPCGEIQFLAYVHNAEDQIRGEAATLAFFSQGQFTNPMVLRIAGLAYQKGFGGHFHNDNSISIFRDIPGLIVAVPSRGDDAVQMMRTCAKEAYENGRVVIFIEPIALYMTKDLHSANDKLWSFPYPAPDKMIPMGQFGVHGEGQDLSIITFGNGTYYSLQAQKELQEKYGIQSKIIDLRWISPIDEVALAEAVQHSEHILIVDECRKTGSLSEFLLSSLAQNLEKLPPTQVLAAIDCFIPLGVAAAAGLPKKAEIVQAAVELTSRNRKLQ